MNIIYFIHILFLLFLCLSLDIISPEGIAIDWISRRIYWADSSKDTIEVASLDDAKLRAVVIQGNLVNPRGIAVDPHLKYDSIRMIQFPNLFFLKNIFLKI